MTEDEWNACDDATAMMRSQRGRIGERKLRLLACACARVRWSGIEGEERRSSVVLAERYADGLATHEELRKQEFLLFCVGFMSFPGEATDVVNQIVGDTLEPFAVYAAECALERTTGEGPAIIRDLIAHPAYDASHVPLADGRWDVLARTIYDEHRFMEMPRLAELLEDAGCRDERLLTHLRSPSPHFRGCWALDAVLGNGQGKAVLTEAEWRAETNPGYLLRIWTYLRDAPSPRKHRLLSCACCRIAPQLLSEPPLRHALEVAEAFADGRSGADELAKAGEEPNALALSRGKTLGRTHSDNPDWAPLGAAWMAARAAAFLCDPPHHAERYLGYALPSVTVDGTPGRDSEDAERARLVRDVLGSPLRSIVIDPSWLRPEVATLARRIYDERAFEHCPTLAAMLEEAGCREDAVLSHLREEPSAHVRGCWVLDALLGRS